VGGSLPYWVVEVGGKKKTREKSGRKKENLGSTKDKPRPLRLNLRGNRRGGYRWAK